MESRNLRAGREAIEPVSSIREGPAVTEVKLSPVKAPEGTQARSGRGGDPCSC